MLFIISLVIAGLAFFYWRQADIKVKQYNEAYRGSKAAAAVVAAVFGLIALLQLFTVIPAGHVGVVDFFGRVSPNTLQSGMNIRNPLARIIKFSIKTQQVFEEMDVPSREGLTVKLDVSVLFHLDPERPPRSIELSAPIMWR